MPRPLTKKESTAWRCILLVGNQITSATAAYTVSPINGYADAGSFADEISANLLGRCCVNELIRRLRQRMKVDLTLPTSANEEIIAENLSENSFATKKAITSN